MPRTELPPVYASADVYVLPSLGEGFPLTSIEAMACGLPVIVSEHTFADDVITNGVEGWVVPIRSSAAIAEHLRTLALDATLRAQMGRASRRRAEQFPWTSYGNRIVRIVGTDLSPETPSGPSLSQRIES